MFQTCLVLATKTDNNVHGHKVALNMGENVPAEIVDAEKFVSTSERAEYCSVKRMKDYVKLKLRTPSKLYTLKVEPLKAEEIIKKLQCEIREI
jgi:hypothetical protein